IAKPTMRRRWCPWPPARTQTRPVLHAERGRDGLESHPLGPRKPRTPREADRSDRAQHRPSCRRACRPIAAAAAASWRAVWQQVTHASRHRCRRWFASERDLIVVGSAELNVVIAGIVAVCPLTLFRHDIPVHVALFLSPP